MNREQPVPHLTPVTANISRADENGAAEIIPPQERVHSKDDAVILSLVSGHQDTHSAPPAKKWTTGRTIQFALASCGLFWVAVVLLVWTYLHAH